MISWFKSLSLPKQLTYIVLTAILLSTLVSLVALGKIITAEVNKLTKATLVRETDLMAEQLISKYQEVKDRTELLSGLFNNYTGPAEGRRFSHIRRTIVVPSLDRVVGVRK